MRNPLAGTYLRDDKFGHLCIASLALSAFILFCVLIFAAVHAATHAGKSLLFKLNLSNDNQFIFRSIQALVWLDWMYCNLWSGDNCKVLYSQNKLWKNSNYINTIRNRKCKKDSNCDASLSYNGEGRNQEMACHMQTCKSKMRF